MTVLASLTYDALRGAFDPATLHRGLEYASSRRVSEPRIESLTRDSVGASALVRGSGAATYSVQLYADAIDGEVWVESVCSCPIGHDCKHGAALALTLGRTFEPPGRSGEDTLRGLLDELAEQARPDADLPPLALEFQLGPSRQTVHDQHRDHPVVRLRPLRMGARGRWVKGGIDWRGVTDAVARGEHPRAQLSVIDDLYQAVVRGGAYWYGGYRPDLASFGPRLLPMLREAVEAGVTLVPVRPLAEVRLSETPARLLTDVTSADSRTRLRFGVEHDGRVWFGEGVIPLGSPVHTVALHADGVLHLAPTERPIPARAASLLVRPESLELAGGESPGDYLAPLARFVDVRSSDGSVAVPEPIEPTLVVTVTWHSSTKVSLRWEWDYASRRCGLTSSDPLGGLRHPGGEAAIRARVPADLLGRESAGDGEALALAIHDLPALAEIDDVRVVEEERPDFREADVDPEISFDVVEETESVGLDWLDLRVMITVEGEQVPLPDVLTALTTGADFVVLPSGLYLATDRPEFEKLREVVTAAAELRDRHGDRVGVGRHDLGLWAQLAEIGVVDAQAAEWVQRAQALRDLTEIPRPEATGTATELRHYQRDGFHWLAFLWQHRLGGILADDMGLGKTLQVLALVRHTRTEGETRPFLVVAPTSVVTAWESESTRHTPDLRVRTIGQQADDVAAAAAEADIVVTTYALLRLARDAYADVEWAGLVLDEAHQVKNHRSKTYLAARTVPAPFRLAVTGTPFENRLIELWSLLSLTNPGLYPRPQSFVENVVKPVEKAGDERALRRFQQRIRPFVLRRTKELVAAELPAKQEQVLQVALSPRHRKLYDAHLAKERQRILGLVDDFEQNRVAIFAALTKLRQLALDPALVDPAHDRVGSAKLDLLADHLTEILAEGHQVLVFSQFTSYLSRVAARLSAEGIATSYLDGATRDRRGAIDEFRSGRATVFLISLKAGGVGLTLTEADYVFVLDPWWNPAAEAQAVDRAHRIGQDRHVHVYRLISSDTIEEKVMELKDRKAALFAQVVDGGGAGAAGIEAEDIRALFEG